MKIVKKWAFRLLLVWFLFTQGLSFLEDALKETEYMEVEVKPGDSIWSIASEWSNESEYGANSMVEWIIERNHKWDSVILPGDILVIPVEAEKIVVAAEG